MTARRTWAERRQARHRLRVDPATHEIRCGCGRTWSGYGAHDEAEQHRDQFLTLQAWRDERLQFLRAGRSAREAATAWLLTVSGARSYLRGLRRRGLARQSRELDGAFRYFAS